MSCAMPVPGYAALSSVLARQVLALPVTFIPPPPIICNHALHEAGSPSPSERGTDSASSYRYHLDPSYRPNHMNPTVSWCKEGKP